jgi:hypothetical protein
VTTVAAGEAAVRSLLLDAAMRKESERRQEAVANGEAADADVSCIISTVEEIDGACCCESLCLCVGAYVVGLALR